MDINENIEYLKAKTGILETELSDLKKKISDVENDAKTQESKPKPPNKRWRAKKGETYWYMNGIGLLYEMDPCNQIYETNDNMDDYLYSIGNYFRTKEEALFEYERLKVINELKEWTTDKESGVKYIIGFVSDSISSREPKFVLKIMKSDNRLALRYTREVICFEHVYDAKNAIKAVGEQRILKYYFTKDVSDIEEEEN